jgi:hypothetical protein
MTPPVRRSTPKKRALAHLIVANTSSPSPLSMQEVMERAGYSPSTARARHAEIIGAVRQEPEVQDHLGRLIALRSKILDRIEVTVETADFRSLGGVLAVFEKNIHLLEGRATERFEHTLTSQEREELERILEENE